MLSAASKANQSPEDSGLYFSKQPSPWSFTMSKRIRSLGTKSVSGEHEISNTETTVPGKTSSSSPLSFLLTRDTAYGSKEQTKSSPKIAS